MLVSTMIRCLPLLIIISTLNHLPPICCLYRGCNDAHTTFCIGSKDNQTAVRTGGCIESKDCNIIIRIEKKSGNSYDWEWVFKSVGSSTMSLLVITNEAMKTRKDAVPMPKSIPSNLPDHVPHFRFWNNSAQLQVITCAYRTVNHPRCYRILQVYEGDSHNFVKFANYEQVYIDASGDVAKGANNENVTFVRVTGTSGKIISVNMKNLQNEGDPHLKINKTVALNLENDMLSFSFSLWKIDKVNNELVYLLQEDISGIEPVRIIKPKNDLWLWIVVAVIGVILVIAFIIVCCCYCRRKKKRTRRRQPRPAIKAAKEHRRPITPRKRSPRRPRVRR